MKERKIVNLIAAALTTLALSFSFQIVELADVGSSIVNFMSKFALAFPVSYFVDMALFVGVFFLIEKFCAGKKLDITTCVTSLIFAFLFVVGQSYKNYGKMALFTANTFQLFAAILTVAGFGILFYIFQRMLFSAIENTTFHESKNPSSKKLWLTGFGIILFFYTIWSLLNCPGTFNPDAQQQVDQVLGNLEWENVHPPFGSIIMGGLFNFGIKVGSPNLGAYLYLLLQNLVCALAFSYGIKKCYEWGAGIKTSIAMLCFFAINPFWLTYAQLYNKDQLYVGVMTFFTVFIADVIKRKEIVTSDLVKIIVTSLIAALLRKNGIYSIVPTLFLLIFAFGKIEKKKIIAVLAGILLIYELVNKALYPALGIGAGSIREALSMPFQQTANYVKYYGDDVTAEEKEAIDAVLAYDEIAEKYNPGLSSPVKDTYKEDASKLAPYFKVWFEMFFKHPGSYFNAFMGQTFCYLAPVYSDNAGVDVELEKWEAKRGLTKLSSKGPLFVKQIKNIGEQAPIIKYFGDPGVYTWLLIIALVILLKRKRYTESIFLIPNVMNLLVCFASPANGSSRYALPLIAMAPFYIYWVVWNYKNEKKI